MLTAEVRYNGERQDNFVAGVVKVIGTPAENILRDSVVLEDLGSGKAIIRAQVRKVISIEDAVAIVTGEPLEGEK